MNRVISVLTMVIFMLTFLVGSSITAQMAPAAVTTPVSGDYTFVGNLTGASTMGRPQQLFVVDTNTGDIELLATSDEVLSSPIWKPGATALTYGDFYRLYEFEPDNGSRVELLYSEEYIPSPLGWSPSGSKLLYSLFAIPASGTSTYIVYIFDQASLNSTELFTFSRGEVLSGVPLPVLPIGISSLEFESLRDITWNPVYEEWILIDLTANSVEEITTSESSGVVGFEIVFAYNLQSGQMVSLNNTINEKLRSPSPKWSPDGRFLAVHSTDNLYIVEFDPLNGSFASVDSAPLSGTVVLDWLGAGDLLLSSNTQARYIAQLIDGNLHTVEFFRFSDSTFSLTIAGDWRITAAEEEKRELTCIFDQTLVESQTKLDE